MDDLRTILLLIGIGVILGVYGWTRFQHRSPGPARRRDRTRPVSNADPDDEADIERELDRMQHLVEGRDLDTAAMDSEQLIVLSVVAPEGSPFNGPFLARAFEHNGLQYGDQSIYYRMAGEGAQQVPVFCVANLVKPGTFAPGTMDDFTSPGLTLILQLPGPFDAADAFDDLVNTAERLAVELGGELRDKQQHLLSHQDLMRLRADVFETPLAT